MSLEATTFTGPLQAVQHIRKMRGGSQAHLIRASDHHFYVTKFQNNPQDIRVLANEYLGTKLGRLLGLPMPEARIMDVSEVLIASTPALSIEMAGKDVPCASGLQFASRYVIDPQEGSVFDYLPDAMFHRIDNREDFPRVLAFDKWTGNSDARQAVFVKPRRRRSYHAYFIDQGYCFNAGEWNFNDSPLRGTFARNGVYEAVTGWHSFEPVISRIEEMDMSVLRGIADDLPEEWYRKDSQGMLDLLDALHKRRQHVRQRITDFRQSSRNPFPSWKQD